MLLLPSVSESVLGACAFHSPEHGAHLFPPGEETLRYPQINFKSGLQSPEDTQRIQVSVLSIFKIFYILKNAGATSGPFLSVPNGKAETASSFLDLFVSSAVVVPDPFPSISLSWMDS